MHLFANELSTSDAIRDEVDLGIELPVVCDLANEFLQPVPLSAADADEVDEMLATLLRHTSPSLKLEVAERLAHVSQGPRRTMHLLAYDRSRRLRCRCCGTRSFSPPRKSPPSRGFAARASHHRIT